MTWDHWVTKVLFACVVVILLLSVRLLMNRFGRVVATIFSMRYGLLLAAGSALLAAFSAVNQSLLLAMLLTRPESTFKDLWIVTTTSLLTSALGISICRLVSLHAADQSKRSVRRIPKAGWPLWLIAQWWLFGMILPAMTLQFSLVEKAGELGDLASGLATGFVTANLIILLLAVLQQWAIGHLDGAACSGILPFERLVDRIGSWKVGSINIPGQNLATWLFGKPGTGLSWILKGPGFTDSKDMLLAGHAQLFIVAAVTGAVYLLTYWRDMADDRWESPGWPSSFFALLIIFVVGAFIAGVAFWLDRYSLPALGFVVGYVIFVFSVSVSDHFIDIGLAPTDKTGERTLWIPTEGTPVPEADSKSNTFLLARSKREATEPEQPYLAEIIQNRKFPGEKGSRTLVVVTASGGGIQAAAWSAKVLTELDKTLPGFGDSIGLISSVSGGSVGTMYYLGLRGANKLDTMPADLADKIVVRASDSALEACAWGWAYPDLIRTMFPPAVPALHDRGFALESAWWNRMGRDSQDRYWMSDVTIRDLIPLVKDGRIPAVIFNATCVETGQRVQISPIHVDIVDPNKVVDPEKLKQAADEAQGDELAATPIDFLKFFDDVKAKANGHVSPANIRVSTAVRLSATFTYVAPVARPRDIPLDAPEKLKNRLNLHFCDGGYADNPGLLTAVRAVRDLLDFYRSQKVGDSEPLLPFDRVVIVRIEPFPREAAAEAESNRGFQAALLGPLMALSATRTSSQAERGELELQLLQEAHEPGKSASDKLIAAGEALKESSKQLAKTDAEVSKEYTNLANMISETVRGGANRGRYADPRKQAAAYSKFAKELQNSQTRLRKGANLRSENTVVSQLQSAERTASALSEKKTLPIYVKSITFRFPPRNKKSQLNPPLSWSLSPAQKRHISDSWDHLRNGDLNQIAPGTADTLSPAALAELFPKR